MTAPALDALSRAAAARGEVLLYIPAEVRRYYAAPTVALVSCPDPRGVK